MPQIHLPKSVVPTLLVISMLANFNAVQAKPITAASNFASLSASSGRTEYFPVIDKSDSTGSKITTIAVRRPRRTPTPTTDPVTPTATPTATKTLSPTATMTPTATSSTSLPVGVSGAWKLKFNDDFNGSTLDSSKWRTCFWWAATTCSIESNNELELYNPDDVLVQNGMLRLRAQKRNMVAWNGKTYNYTSGMVMTGGLSGSTAPEFAYTYGFAEAKIQVPAGQGLWPAFWMLPTSYAWPPEIDAMEILGNQPNLIHMTFHYSGGQQGFEWTGPDFSAGWHVVGLDWEPTAITWYVDGVERARFTDTSKIPTTPLYLLLNLAVGGSWPGSPDASTVFPSYFNVDYVRVWQK